MTSPYPVAIEARDGGPAPVVNGRTVGEIVLQLNAALSAGGLGELKEQAPAVGLPAETLEKVLSYCAGQHCIADGVTCPGCRRRTEALGFSSLDDFARGLKRITASRTGVELQGPGEQDLAVETLADFATRWAGEEFWFKARRVIRKLRHGVRRSGSGGALSAMETPAVILMEPQLAENIGMVARACANFGLADLRLIDPRDGWPNDKARIAASGASYMIDEAVAVPTMKEAIGDLNFLAATTARQRDLRKPVLTPEAAIAEIRTRLARGERCGLLFGRERNGLTTDEVAAADAVIMIEVNPEFASLNLAQAVLILGYEWMKGSKAASLGRVTNYETPLASGFNMGADRLATYAEMEGLFEHLETELVRLGFFNPIDKRGPVMRNLRSAFLRMQATEQEVRTLRGIVATLAHGKGAGRKRAR